MGNASTHGGCTLEDDVHISVRIAWHTHGWNGSPCRQPRENVHCVGPHSYPGEMIAERRKIVQESEGVETCTSDFKGIPACVYSINAFGANSLTAFSPPPPFFNDSTEVKYWELPPATVCTWPYEEMYGDDIKRADGTYDNDARLQKANEYFGRIEEGKSLIFYYCNYSNPFSDEDSKRYVLVGVSRVKSIGRPLIYENCSERVLDRYAGGMVWQRNITSYYPEQGFRLPYHACFDRPEILGRFLLIPDNSRNFKYATRQFASDDALVLVERLLECVGTLQEIGDTSEDWTERRKWLESLVAELWDSRGLFPGMTKVLQLLDFTPAIPYFKKAVLEDTEKEAYAALFGFLDGTIQHVEGLSLDAKAAKTARRQWALKSDAEKRLLRDVLPRFDLAVDQMERLLSPTRSEHGIYSSLEDVAENPYILTEQYVGDDPDDYISFHKIDHGVLPSPELGGEPLFGKDDWQRLRALCVERLKGESRHCFAAADKIMGDVNRRILHLPEWKKHTFSTRYLEVDEEDLSVALEFRQLDEKRYVYLKSVYEDERMIEHVVRQLAGRPDISFRTPITDKHWKSYLTNTDSVLSSRAPKDYEAAIEGQTAVTEAIFPKPVSVICGSAGTGKTTVVKAIIEAIQRAHGAGTSFQLLAPTGKAADRLREATGQNADTIHSFLARYGWLNPNMTFKRTGGQQIEGFQTVIVDEASMLDLELAATLFRSIHWAHVQRLILVGDPNQLPPIGRGRVFADVIDWLSDNAQGNVGVLNVNIRQMENRIRDRGTGILELADLYVGESEIDKATAEELLRRVQEGGDVDKDLRVLYWHTPEELHATLTETIVKDMQEDSGVALDQEKPYFLWNAAFKDEYGGERPEYQQIISPYRAELFGTEELNRIIQKHRHGREVQEGRHLGGICLFDKVIQIRNRPKSNPLWAYNIKTRNKEKLVVYNGELGFVKPHAFDKKKWMWPDFRIEHFQVVFSRKRDYWVEYTSSSAVEDNLELGYAISVHKSQGSEFDRVYFVLPKRKKALLSRELFYTGITRSTRHCTLLIEEDISPLTDLRRPEKSHLLVINSSLFKFVPVSEDLLNMAEWYEEGKIHRALADIMVRSKSEVIIANLLFDRDIPFRYEIPLFAPDGTFYLPDFTITWRGEEWYWEHWGLVSDTKYQEHRKQKEAWYEKHFAGRLVATEESGNLSKDAQKLIEEHFS